MAERTTAGTASMMNSHCQPAKPSNPSIPSSAPEIGAPITVEIGIATMKDATMAPR